MRIACIHVPQFALQCVTRTDPGLRGAAVAVVIPWPRQRHVPQVTACSRAAWAVGVRPGMPASAAHALSADLIVVPADATSERELVRALADVVLALSPVVDVGRRVGANETHLALYAEVPSKMRGSSFGERVLERLAAINVTARIGIADDRFTAWVAAISEHDAEADSNGSITSVPRGGSAAFLAPRSLSLLSISPEVQHMLESLGVATIGEFAALPAPSHAVVRPLEADYRALARGESGHALRPYAPDAPIREELALRHTSVPAAVALLAERVALRLAGRARGAARIEVMASGEGGEWLLPVSLADGTTAEQLADAIGAALAEHQHQHPQHPSPWRVRVVVTGERLLGEPQEMEEVAASTSASASMAAPVDALAVVLSSTGAFGLRAERRALHRAGARRSKTQRNHRRTSTSAQAELVQARLFKS
jgi:impB/mucB/samB family protein